MREWLLFHRIVGVEHFWVYDAAGSVDGRRVLDPYVATGTVEVIPWPIASGHFIARQVAAHQDALRRARHWVTWLALIDVDEYLLPVDRDTVPACLDLDFRRAAAVYVNWRTLGTGHVRLADEDSILSRITACSRRDHPSNASGKSIVRPDQVQIERTWSPHHFVLEPGADYYDGDGRILECGETEPRLDGRTHDRHIRINHYQLGDETYFRDVRLKRRVEEGFVVEPWVEWEHYESYSQDRDRKMVDFLVRRRPGFVDDLRHPAV